MSNLLKHILRKSLKVCTMRESIVYELMLSVRRILNLFISKDHSGEIQETIFKLDNVLLDNAKVIPKDVYDATSTDEVRYAITLAAKAVTWILDVDKSGNNFIDQCHRFLENTEIEDILRRNICGEAPPPSLCSELSDSPKTSPLKMNSPESSILGTNTCGTAPPPSICSESTHSPKSSPWKMNDSPDLASDE